MGYYGWPDHHNPPLELLLRCVDAMHTWLSDHRENVVAVHCKVSNTRKPNLIVLPYNKRHQFLFFAKAGLGRTGTVICCYFLYAGFLNTPEEAIDFFGEARSINGRGIRVPSQIRFPLHLLLLKIFLFRSLSNGT